MFEEEASKIRLDEAGWKGRYYKEKLGAEEGEGQEEAVGNIVKVRGGGLAWAWWGWGGRAVALRV